MRRQRAALTIGEASLLKLCHAAVTTSIERKGLREVAEGNRRLWLRADLDAAILPDDLRRVQDVAEDL